MVWDIELRSHITAGMVWVLNGMSHGTVYLWDIPMGCPIGMLFLEVIMLAAAAEQ